LCSAGAEVIVDGISACYDSSEKELGCISETELNGGTEIVELKMPGILFPFKN